MNRLRRGICREHREEGQIIPALLLVVVALIFFALLFVQVGSASEQKTQTQTAADSAAVATAHAMRDAGIIGAGWQLPFSFSYLFRATAIPDPMLASTACDAAQRNWVANPHNSPLSCGQLAVFPDTGGVRVDLTAPAGEVVGGPAQVQDKKAQADATAQVVLADCPQLAVWQQKAVADWLIDTTLTELGSSSHCSTPDELTRLHLWDKSLTGALAGAAVIGPPNLIDDAVRAGIRTELTDD